MILECVYFCIVAIALPYMSLKTNAITYFEARRYLRCHERL